MSKNVYIDLLVFCLFLKIFRRIKVVEVQIEVRRGDRKEEREERRVYTFNLMRESIKGGRRKQERT